MRALQRPGGAGLVQTSVRLSYACRRLPTAHPTRRLVRAQSDEAVFCTACKRHTTATKTLRLCRLPRVLLLHIKARRAGPS